MPSWYTALNSVDQLRLLYGGEIDVDPEQDDASSVSSIEYNYSEEEYYQSEDEDVKKDYQSGDEDEDVQSGDDQELALKYNLKLLSDSEEEDDDKAHCNPPTPEHVSLPPPENKLLQQWLPHYPTKPPLELQLHFWVGACRLKTLQTHFAWVNVYAYYNKNKGYGGFGVILRNSNAVPLTATAMYSSDAKSFFTQVLMGVKAAVLLAQKHGISELCVESNSMNLPSLVNLLWDCSKVKCRDGAGICKGCLGSFFYCSGSDLSLVPLAREIKALAPKGQHLQDLLQYPSTLNKAAHYLAKMEKKRALEIKNQVSTVRARHEWPAEIQPCDFPPKLKVTLLENAFAMMHDNSLRGW